MTPDQPGRGVERAGGPGGDVEGGAAGRGGGAAADAGDDHTARERPERDAACDGARDALAGRRHAAAVVRGGLARAESEFRRVKGHRDMPTLMNALEESTRARPSGIEHGVA